MSIMVKELEDKLFFHRIECERLHVDYFTGNLNLTSTSVDRLKEQSLINYINVKNEYEKVTNNSVELVENDSIKSSSIGDYIFYISASLIILLIFSFANPLYSYYKEAESIHVLKSVGKTAIDYANENYKN